MIVVELSSEEGLRFMKRIEMIGWDKNDPGYLYDPLILVYKQIEKQLYPKIKKEKEE